MSIYTKEEKVKSLWHPITDEDFEIDFSKPFFVYSESGLIFIVDDMDDMYIMASNKSFYDFETQTLTEKGKDWFRSQYFGYMYIDDDFFKAIDRAKGKCIEDVKGEREVAPLFVMYKSGCMYVTDFFDFFDDGSPGTNSVCFSRSYIVEHSDDDPIDYIVNLNHVSETQLSALFRAPLDKPKTAYVVTSGEYSDYRVDGVFSDKEKAVSFAKKAEDRTIEKYNIDDEEQLRKEYWYEISIRIDNSSKAKNVSVNDLSQSGQFFDAVRFRSGEGIGNCFYFYLKAIDRDKAKAIALERFHALLAVESSHFPMLRWTRDISPHYGPSDLQEGLVFGYFDYKAYFYPYYREEKIQDLFMKIKDSLPIPLTEKDKIDWQNLTEDACLQIMNNHGLKIESRKDLPLEFI